MLRIKDVLKAKGVTSKQLAEKLGKSEGAISLTINGNPTADTLEKIADALGVGVGELFEPQQKNTDLRCPHCGGIIKIKIE